MSGFGATWLFPSRRRHELAQARVAAMAALKTRWMAKQDGVAGESAHKVDRACRAPPGTSGCGDAGRTWKKTSGYVERKASIAGRS
jgi:hypothetical protein